MNPELILLTIQAWTPYIVTELLKRLFKNLPDPAVINGIVSAGLAAGIEHLSEGPWSITMWAVYTVLGIIVGVTTHNAGHAVRFLRDTVEIAKEEM